MIINEEVEVRWNGTTRKHYEEKGYIYTKNREFFTINIKDLPDSSGVRIDVSCDYCKTTFNRIYADVLKSVNKSLFNKYSCSKCEPLKRAEELQVKQQEGLLNRGDKGYWNFKDNRVKEVKCFVEENENIENLQHTDVGLFKALHKHRDSLKEIVESLGYEWNAVSSSTPNHFYKDFEKVRTEIALFISVNNRFPSHSEIINDIRITSKNIIFHGGMDNIKKKMNYQDENDLLDDNGFKNRSKLEYFVAQYLIANDISYTREKEPFEENKFRCDFLIVLECGEKYYIEVWGYARDDLHRVGAEYNAGRRAKEGFYEKHNLKLISLEYDEMEGKRYKVIQEYLKEAFAVLSDKTFVSFEDTTFLHPTCLSDEDILNVIMKHSNDKTFLPLQKDVIESGLVYYLNEIRKRHGSYLEFAKLFDKELVQRKKIWNEKTIYDTFFEIVNITQQPINIHTIKSANGWGMMNITHKLYGRKGFTLPKLIFYLEYINNHSIVHEDDIILIRHISQLASPTARYTQDDIDIAKKIVLMMCRKNIKVAL